MMAAKKGSKVSKASQRTLRLEVQTPTGDWGKMATADTRDEASTEWLTDMAASMKKGKMTYRLVETIVTTRTQTTESILEGEGAPKRASNGA